MLHFISTQFTLKSTAVAPYVMLDSGNIDGYFRWVSAGEWVGVVNK